MTLVGAILKQVAIHVLAEVLAGLIENLLGRWRGVARQPHRRRRATLDGFCPRCSGTGTGWAGNGQGRNGGLWRGSGVPWARGTWPRSFCIH